VNAARARHPNGATNEENAEALQPTRSIEAPSNHGIAELRWYRRSSARSWTARIFASVQRSVCTPSSPQEKVPPPPPDAVFSPLLSVGSASSSGRRSTRTSPIDSYRPSLSRRARTCSPGVANFASRSRNHGEKASPCGDWHRGRDQARHIGRRALQAISIPEPQGRSRTQGRPRRCLVTRHRTYPECVRRLPRPSGRSHHGKAGLGSCPAVARWPSLEKPRWTASERLWRETTPCVGVCHPA
jgi:hypothetical protein